MKNILPRFICLFLCATLFSGCTYHGKIHHGIYKHRDFKEKIDARVMVVSDKFYPKSVSADLWDIYTYKLNDGLPTAVADALRTLFTEVEVNAYEHRNEYDFIAEIDYEVHLTTGTSKFTFTDVMLPYHSDAPILVTAIKLTMRNPQTGYAVTRYEHNSYQPIQTYHNDPGLFLSHLLTICSLGILYPVDIQVFGAKLRQNMEYGLTRILYRHIMPEMREDRFNFTRTHDTENTNIRVDGNFLPFMKSTVYIISQDGTGSGFFVSPNGYIITNAHVVRHNRDVEVVLYDERAILDKTSPTASPEQDTIRNKMRFARVLKINKKRDLALLKIEGENYPWLELETDRQNYTTGRKVVAIGAPRNIEWSVSEGIISAARDNDGVDTIQTDAAVNHGNSGGPLIDLESGKVIGVNSWKKVPERNLADLSRGIENLNFAISSYEVQRTLGVHQPMREEDYPKPTDSDLQTIPKPYVNYVKYE